MNIHDNILTELLDSLAEYGFWLAKRQGRPSWEYEPGTGEGYDIPSGDEGDER